MTGKAIETMHRAPREITDWKLMDRNARIGSVFGVLSWECEVEMEVVAEWAIML